MNHHNDSTTDNDGGLQPHFLGADYSGSSFGSVFDRRDSFGSNSSNGMMTMMPMGMDDTGMMDDRFFALDDPHTMNNMGFSDPKSAPGYQETAPRTINPMQLHQGAEIMSEEKEFKHAPSSGIPPIISVDEMKSDVTANANSFNCNTSAQNGPQPQLIPPLQQQQQPQSQQMNPIPTNQIPINQQAPASSVGVTATAAAAGDKAASKPEPRKKLWKCTFPGCTEPPKTHYNCYSHVWDSHIRHSLPQENPLGAVVYKKIVDKTQVKELCKKYMIELDDVNRKRRRNKKGSPEQNTGQQYLESSANPIILNPSCGMVVPAGNPGNAGDAGDAYPQGFPITAISTNPSDISSSKMSVEPQQFYPVNPQLGMGPPQKRLHQSTGDYSYNIYTTTATTDNVTIPCADLTTNTATLNNNNNNRNLIKPEITSDSSASPMDYQQSAQQIQGPLQQQPSLPATGATAGTTLMYPTQQLQTSCPANTNPALLPKDDLKMMGLSGNGIPAITPLGSDLPQQQQYFIPQGQLSGSSSAASSSASPVVASGGDTPISPGKIVVVPPQSGCDTMAGVDHSYSLDQDGVTKIIVNSNGLARLYVCGEVFAEHGFLQRSDARFKEQIMPISGALNKVLQITGKTFKYKGDGSSTTRMGFIAQELEEVVPTAVYRDEHGLSVDVVSLVPLILEALKEIYHNTLSVESEQAQKLNEAVKDAMDKVQELDRKFEDLRNSDDSSDDDSDSSSSSISDSSNDESSGGSSSSDESSEDEHAKSKRDSNRTHKNNKNTSKHHKHHKGNTKKNGGSKKGKSKKERKSTKNSDHSTNRKVVQNGEYELGVRKSKGGAAGGSMKAAKEVEYSSTDEDESDDTDYPFSYIFQRDKKESGHFRYKFSFGPPLVVLISILLFFAAGIFALSFVRNMPFVWIYCFFSAAVLIASLIFQKDEFMATFRNLEIKLYWHPENTLNSYFLAVIATIGLVLTLILGLTSVVCVGILFFVLIATWMFSVIAHNKYNVRIQSIFIMCSGILVFMGCCFGFIYMAQPFQCEFEGYSGPTIEVPVYVGRDINHIQIKSIPWNCFFSQIELSNPLPDTIRLNTESTLPFFEGYVNSTFDSVPTQVTLYCNQHQGFKCGTLVFQPCLSYVDELQCKSNGCSWCADYGPNKTGTCGFCNRDFTTQCFDSTGAYPSCVNDMVTSDFVILKPLKSLLLFLLSLL